MARAKDRSRSTEGASPTRNRAQLGLDPDTWCPDVVDHYRYVLGRPELDGVLLQLGHEQHVADLVEALAAGPLEPEEAEHLELLGRIAKR